MANLIPQKQVREVNDFLTDIRFRQDVDITGSATIGEDLVVGGDVSIDGTLFTSQSFQLGSDPNERSLLTGSVEITGSLTIDGNLAFANAANRLDATASYADEALNTLLFDRFTSQDFQAQRPTLYVSSTAGSDDNDGRTLQYPLRTIKKAAEIAEAGYDGRYGFDTGSVFNGYVIKVQAGTYLEDNPVILPSNTTVWGAGLRITKINARNPEQDLFWVNSGCYIAEVTVGGLRLWPDQINPERGFGFAFQPGAFITTSPYVQNCSQISNQENSFTELYEDIPPGGGGLYVNGDAVDPDSPLASMVLDAYTQISPNGVGCLVNGRGFIQLVSFFNNFSYYAIRVNNGGHATLNNSNISFGEFGMYASGSRFITGSGGDTDSFQKVQDGWSVIVDVLNRGLDALPEITVLNTDSGIKVTNYTQSYTSEDSTSEAASEVVSDFTLISNIVQEGNSNFPTLLAKSSTRGYGFDSPWNILGNEQITSSISAGTYEVNHLSESIGTILGIFADGTGSYDFKNNTSSSIKISDLAIEPSAVVASNEITESVSASFNTVMNIIRYGLDIAPDLQTNNSSSIKVSDTEQYSTGVSASYQTIQSVSESFSIVYNILANGTGSTILDIPENHQYIFEVGKDTDSGAYLFDGLGNNPTITLFRGETYKFNLDAGLGVPSEPFFIRTQPISGFDKDDIYNYNYGVINNGDSVGTITFEVPYDAPNTLYYISQDTPSYTGVINIVNNSQTPRELIENTLTYPATIESGSIPSEDVDILNAYDLLIENITFIQDETIEFLSSSWYGFEYNQDTCKRDIRYIVEGVAKDLLYGGNEESIRSGLFYYQYPSDATTTQLGPTKTAVKYVARLAETILQNITLEYPSSNNDSVAQAILDNIDFVQEETILFLSSSWSEFDYNESKCRRDVGYIMSAVATDLRYGGNERSIEAGEYYYLYPSAATGSQLDQTITGIRYAAQITDKIITNTSFNSPASETLASWELIRENKSLIQDETIEFINVTYPKLEYNQSKCRRDVGFILDAVATDLLYGGNERSVTAGKYYYEYPSIATTTQRVETAGGIRYSRIITEYIIQNQILETPRIVTNDERLIKVTNLTNVTSSISATETEQGLISSSFNIVENIVKKGLSSVPAIVAKETNQGWNINNPFNVGLLGQTTSSLETPTESTTIESNWNIVTSIIEGGVSVIPPITSSADNLIKVTSGTQITSNPASSDVTSSISSSFGLVGTIITNGTGSLPELVSNTNNNIKVGSVSLVGGTAGTNVESSSISSSMGIIIDVLVNGLSVLPTLVENTQNNIKVSNIEQWTGSLSGSLEDVSFVSSSISIVTKILETGVYPSIELYTTASTEPSTLAAYEILKENIDFIQDETITYLSSSWRTFEYDEAKCRRDVGLIVSGAAEDLLWGANSASIVNGQFYFEYPSQATGSQLAQTLDGINYASRLAQKLVQNILFVTQSVDKINAASLLVNNKEFIQEETILYISSSWSTFDYVESTCRRDVGYIIDAVATDLIYGGNERTRVAGEYYYLYPSEATGTQLFQTTDAINYASRLGQKIVVGDTFSSPDSENLKASNLMLLNQDLIADEVVAYVSSSWSNAEYNETTCKRDVKYILDAVRTDLVYGGNERTRVAGEFYYRFPSAATVAGVPSVTAQLDPTITGIFYGSALTQNIVLGRELVSPSETTLTAVELVRNEIPKIQQNTIDFVSDTYPQLVYDVARCYRDVGFIIDGVLTDLVYGGNERSVTSGYFYYKFPSQATGTQVEETIDALNFAKGLVKLIAVGNGPVEFGFDVVARIIESGSSAYPTLVSNTEQGIKKTNTNQITSSVSASSEDIQIVSSSFGNVINIVTNGTGSIPTIVENTERGVLISTGSQTTSSFTPNTYHLGKVTSGFDLVLDIIENGTGSLPSIQTNASSSIKRGNVSQYITTASISTTITDFVNNGFDIVTSVIENGTGSLPNLVKNTKSNIKVSDVDQYTSSTAISASLIRGITGSFDVVLDIIENGTGSLPTEYLNSQYNIKVTDTEQYVSESSVTSTEVTFISESIGSVVDIILNGTGSLPVLVENTNSNIKVSNIEQYISSSKSGSTDDISFISESISLVTYIIETGISISTLPTIVQYVTQSTDESTYAAYEILKNNISFIQNETIAYLSSSWKGFEFNEASCSRDIGLIISGAAEDLLWGANSASIVNGKFYYEYPSQATTTQLNQTLDGINYASRLAQKLIQNIEFVTASSDSLLGRELLDRNRELIQNETIAYISSSWSTHEYNQETCKRDVGYILDAVKTDLVYGGNERTRQAGLYYYLYPSTATTTQLEETLDGIRWASNLSQKVVQNIELVSQSNQRLAAYDLIFNNKEFIQEETIAYLSSSWSEHSYNETTCKRDVGFILDAVGTDLVYGGNERSITAGVYYYLYPSNATGSELEPTLTGVRYARNLVEQILGGSVFTTPSQEKLDAYELIYTNKQFIQDETILFLSASWSEFDYNQETCKRDVGYILDAVATDVLYGGNERSSQAGEFYYRYPSTATTAQLDPTLTGVNYAKGITERILQNVVFVEPSLSAQTAYNLLFENKDLIQTETILYVDSAWSFFNYNREKCRRDVGYIVDAVATDILYGGNERSIIAGEFYYKYPSLAIINDNQTGQLDETLDGVRYAKGISEKISQNIELQTPSESETAGYELLIQNKPLIQNEVIAFVSSSWSGVDGFFYNEASCSRDIAYITDAVATDLLYGGNQRSSKAGEYYFLYPSRATVAGYASPDAQLDQTTTGIRFGSGIAQKIINNTLLVPATEYVIDSYNLLLENKEFIQDETIQYIDAFFPFLVYNRTKCRRDVGYIVDAVATDLLYGGNERAITAGDYYYRFPNKATTTEQVVETVAGVDYAKEVAKLVVSNILLPQPTFTTNIDSNIKATEFTQYTSSISATQDEITKISSSFEIVTNIISGGLDYLPTITSNNDGLIKVTDLTPTTSTISAGGDEKAKVSSSFGLVRDIVINGLDGIPDSLAKNFDYGFRGDVPTLLHIAGKEQTLGDGSFSSAELTSQTSFVSSSYGTIIDIISNGLDVIPTLTHNTSGSLKRTNGEIYSSSINGGVYEKERVLNGFDIVLDIIENGTTSIPTLVPNTSASIKVTDTPQFLSGSGADRIQSKLVSASFATVIGILETGELPEIVLSGSTPNSNSKINLAYNLLLNNKDMIIDETIAYMSSSWSGFEYTQSLCERDLGYIIDGAAKDLLYGGNEESVRNGEFYFLYPSEATGSQLDQTITAIRFASGISEKVIRNTQLTHISSSLLESVSSSYNLLINNKEFIKEEVITYISSSWSEFDYNQETCKRDVGYIIDAVSTDLLYGGNERSIVAGDYYYRFPSTATTSQLEPTLTGVRYARGLSMNLVGGATLQTASAEVQYSYDLLRDNKVFIQSESVAYVDVKYPHLQYDKDKCFRDTGYIVDAVATDLLYGGNEQSLRAGEFYYLYPSLATGVQVEETVDAVVYGGRLAVASIISEVVSTPEYIPNTSASIKVTNTTQTLGTGTTDTYTLNSLSSSFGLVMDIIINGTGSLPTISDYTQSLNDVEITNVYSLVKSNIGFIQSESIAYVSSSWSEFPYNEASCSRDVGLIVSGAIEDLLFGSVSSSVVNGYYYYLFPSAATGSQLQQTLDGIRYAAGMVDKISRGIEFVTASSVVSSSYNLLRDNKEFIVSESIAFVSSSWSDFEYVQETCGRDIRYIIDAVSTDLLYGGNERSKIAGEFYYLYPSTATSTQLDPTTTAIDYASGLAVKIVENSTFVTASQIVSASVDLIRNNRTFIQEETMAYLTASWSTFEYDKVKCKRDVGYIVDAVATDLLYGGNQRSSTAGEFYYKYPSEATTIQVNQTNDGVRWASRVTQKVVQNIEFVTASQEVSASFDLLRQNKPFIQAETIEYVSSSWSGVYYNEASCSRDVGYIVDAVATDLFYGGTERSIIAGTYYYLYPSRATNAGVPSEQNQLDATTTGIKYAGRISKKVVTNPTYETPSGSALIGRELLMINKEFIQKETIAFLSSSWSTLDYNEVSCSRDLGFILDAVGTDLVYGGNERSIEAGSFYYRIPSVAIAESYTDNGKVGQKKQTADGINYAKGISEKIVNKTQLVFPTTKTRDAYNRLIASKNELKERAIGYTNGAFPYLVYNEASCSRDTGLIVDAVATDLLYGGNERAIAAASSYYTGQYGSAQAVINEQRTETLETNRYLRTLAQNIAANPPLEEFGSLIVATGIDYSYNGAGVTFKALPPNQGGTGVADPTKEVIELGGGRVYFTSGNQDGDFRIGTGLTINQATGTLVGRTFSKSLFSLVTPFSLALEG